jgi:hypothetical protein
MTNLHRFREPSATEAIYLKTATQVISRSRVAGPITPAQFATALAGLESRYVILRAAIWDGHFTRLPGDRVTPVKWLSGVQVDAVYETLLDTPLDLAHGIYTATVLDHGDGFDVFLVTSHAVSDATSLVEIHAFLIYLCDCAVRGAVPEITQQPFPDDIDNAVARCLALLGDRAAPARAPAAYAGPYLRLPAFEHAAPAAFRYRLHRLEIPPAEMRHIIEAAHAHHVSLHSLLAAAFALAIRDLSEVTAPRILVRSSVDLRRRLEPHLPVDLVFSAVTGHITPVEDLAGSIFDIGKRVYADIHGASADGRIFRDYENYPRAFGQPSDAPVAINISDMGVIAFHAEMQALRATGFEYATGLMKTYPNVSITIFEGELVATIVYAEAFLAADTIARLAEGVVEQLRRAEGMGCSAIWPLASI